MDNPDTFLDKSLSKRKEDNAFRQLRPASGLIDFCSNDYLGFARSALLKFKIEEELKKYPYHQIGATGSRLLRGNSGYMESLEAKIAAFHKAKSGLLFNSGYDANIGVLSAIPTKYDTIIYDELVHASIHDGIRLNQAKNHVFKHNNLKELEEILKKSTGNKYIVIESVYSMDGDKAPLKNIVALAKKYDVNIILDEAHATGVFGENGEGIAVELELQDEIFARIHTFGKALGCHGAIVLGSEKLRDYLINFARSFIYTTALPFYSLIAINNAYTTLLLCQHNILKLKYMCKLFQGKLQGLNEVQLIESNSAIQSVIIPGNEKVKKAAGAIQNAGFDVRPILSPTVPKGKERLRICIHAFNTEEDVVKLVDCIKNILN